MAQRGLGVKDVTVFAVGNLRGRFSSLISQLQKYLSKKKSFDMVLCVGQFFENGTSLKTLELKSLINGTIKCNNF
jgi:hypothetical protein